ncbi:MAG: GerAB/ArcD/ProY family transporter [Oscillospiraceae bacterium]|nr:GerAB/ArcD/ProY family transporter [Oscillospiraceae bacterium]
MNRSSAISGAQLVTLLFTSRIFQFLTYSSSGKGQLGGTAMLLATPLALLLTGLLLLPAYLLLRQNRGCGIVDCAYRYLGRAGGIPAAAMGLFALAVAAATVAGFEFFLSAGIYAEIPPWILIVTLTGAAVYAASMGYEPVSRVSTVVFVAFWAAFLFMGAALLPEMDPVYLRPLSYVAGKDFLRLCVITALSNTETVALLFMISVIKGRPTRCFWYWTGLLLAALELIALMTATALGDYGYSQRFPFYALTKIAEFSIFQRLDSLHTALWIFMALIKTSLYLRIAGEAFRFVLPQAARRWAVPGCGAAAALAAGFLAVEPQRTQRLSAALSGGWPVALLAFALPLWLLIRSRKKGKGEAA